MAKQRDREKRDLEVKLKKIQEKAKADSEANAKLIKDAISQLLMGESSLVDGP